MTARSTDTAQVEAQAMTCDHHWISAHQPDFPDAVYWIDRCSLCGAYNGERLSEQLVDLVESRERAIRWAVTLESQNAEALALHKSVYWGDPTHLHCGTCVNDDGEALAWPCPTVAALTGSTE